jgi:formate hydrogenlyase subunit 4
MNDPKLLLLEVLQGLALFGLAPGLLGVLRWVKALGQGRQRGFATLLQPYRDLLRLARQPAVRAEPTGVLFAAAPALVAACYGTLAFAVPWLGQPPLLAIDLIMLVYLLALARFALALAGLDSGAPFGALGSARMMFLSIPTELALVLIGAALALHHGTLSIEKLVEAQWRAGGGYLLNADLLLIALAMLLILSLETARLPIDNPATHLELTMTQKAALLDYAGRDLALLEWAEAIKLALVIGLFSMLFYVPLGIVPLACLAKGDHQWMAAAVLLLMLFGPVGWAVRPLLTDRAKKFAVWAAKSENMDQRAECKPSADHPVRLNFSPIWPAMRMLTFLSIVLGFVGFLLEYPPFEGCVSKEPQNQLWLLMPYLVKALPSLVAALVLAMAVGRLEIAKPKVRLRKAQGRAVLAAGLSLSAILYHVVQGFTQ